MLHVMPREDTEAYAWGDVYDCFYKVNQGEVEYGSSDISMGDWNTSGEPVSVGAWIANNQIKTEDGATMETMDEIGDVAWYSSYGTDRAGHQHPDICAPGNYVAAALNSFDSQYSDYNVYLRKGYTDQFVGQTSSRDYSWGWMSGTSMSTPAAAGVVALWMQAAADLGKTLNCSDIKDIIIHSCDTDEFTARSPERFGLGKINAYKGLLYVLGIETSIEGLSKDQPENVTFRVADDLLYADGAEDGTTVALYNLSGVLVRQTVLQGGTVSLAGLQKGVYAVQLGKLGSTLIRK
jgi:subtilisin family serine protease